ncbi:MAG: hypothetical protein ACE5K4_08135 [Candidatus Hydrothermarchaeota archaeon]
MISRVMFGTSPMIGAGQFGMRSLLYYQKFYSNPKNMTNLFKKSIESGFPDFQLVALPRLVNSLLKLKKDYEFRVLGTIDVEDFETEINLMNEIEAYGCAIHASKAERMGADLNDKLERIKENDMKRGLALHNPHKTMEKLDRLDFDFYLLPLNKRGEFMGDFRKTISLIENTDKKVVSIKPLAAGNIKPEEAFEFIFEYAEGVTVGIADENELISLEIAKTFAEKKFGSIFMDF